MLIEFSVANFRSFKDRQTFSMVADSPHQVERNVLQTGFNAAPNLLETCAIFGPNGSGKSNLIRALDFFSDFVVRSSLDRQRDQPIDEIEPFRFSPSHPNQPSEFEIVFIHSGFLFEYGFSADSKRVYKEYLYATPREGKKQSPQKWFERDVSDPKNSYVRKELKGPKQSWKNETRENALFLSTAVQRNSEAFGIPFEWMLKYLRVLDTSGVSNSFSKAQLEPNSRYRDRILKLMRGLDFSFDDLTVSPTESKLPKKIKFLESIYSDPDGQSYILDFDDESNGTKRLFAFSGPILDVLDNGYTLVVDEMDCAIHPIALRGIVSLFNNPKTNPNNAQLIFSTHNTSLMSILDRDQVVLVDKDPSRSTRIASVSDFDGRAQEAIEKRYLGGRYGALPNIGDLV